MEKGGINKKGDSKIDLHSRDKVLKVTFCSYSIDDVTIQNILIYKRILIDKYDNQINFCVKNLLQC